MLDLAAAAASSEPVRVRCIAEAHGIPARFLVQILLQLKGAGIVTSTRGAAGGYRLAKDPAELSVWDVMCVVEGGEIAADQQRRGQHAGVRGPVGNVATGRGPPARDPAGHDLCRPGRPGA